MADMIDRAAVAAKFEAEITLAKQYMPAAVPILRAVADDIATLPPAPDALDPATIEAIARHFDVIGGDALLTGHECAKGVRGLLSSAKPAPDAVESLVKAAKAAKTRLDWCSVVLNLEENRVETAEIANDLAAALRALGGDA